MLFQTILNVCLHCRLTSFFDVVIFCCARKSAKVSVLRRKQSCLKNKRLFCFDTYSSSEFSVLKCTGCRLKSLTENGIFEVFQRIHCLLSMALIQAIALFFLSSFSFFVFCFTTENANLRSE